MSLLVSVKTKEDGAISVLASDANRHEWMMYAFSKRDAMELARRLDGNWNNLAVINFL